MNLRSFSLWIVAVAVVFIVGVSSAQATILTFSIVDPSAGYPFEDFPEGLGVPGDYGDRVNALSMTVGSATYSYGESGEGFTPNVVVEYGPFSIFTGGPELWRYDYGDLDRVLYQGSRGSPGTNYNHLDIVFTADPFYDVLLYGLDLGGWNQTDYSINGIVVYDGVPWPFIFPTNQLETIASVAVSGAGPTHTSIEFTTPIRAHWLWLRVDARNLGDVSELIGVDNIRFGQVDRTDGTPGTIRPIQIDPDGNIQVVPEPSSISTFLLLGGLSLVARFRRQSRNFLL